MVELMKRKRFLSVFLGALGAVRIIWGELYDDRIYGTVVYAEDNQDERQDFVWYMTEGAVPSSDVLNLIAYLHEARLLDVDKIMKPVSDLELPFIEASKREQVFEELFSIEVRMLDDGEESDSYFIHD